MLRPQKRDDGIWYLLMTTKWTFYFVLNIVHYYSCCSFFIVWFGKHFCASSLPPATITAHSVLKDSCTSSTMCIILSPLSLSGLTLLKEDMLLVPYNSVRIFPLQNVASLLQPVPYWEPSCTQHCSGLAVTMRSVYLLRPDSQPLTRFEAGRPASKWVSVSSFKAGQI